MSRLWAAAYRPKWVDWLSHKYSSVEKGCREKRTRQAWKVLWVALSSLFFKEIYKNGTRGDGLMFASAKGKQQK